MPHVRLQKMLSTLAIRLALACIILPISGGVAETSKTRPHIFLTGKLLVTQPHMSDPRFREAVIFLRVTTKPARLASSSTVLSAQLRTPLS